MALVFGLEAATMIENEVDRLDILYGFGVRQIGIAYSEANYLGSGLKERGDGGLTYFGERAVTRMNKLGSPSISRIRATSPRWTRSSTPRSPSS